MTYDEIHIMQVKTPIEAAVTDAIEQARIVIDKVSPCVDNGRYPARKVVGQVVTISATIFMDGHDKLAANVIWKDSPQGQWRRQAMEPLGNDRWQADIVPAKAGKHFFRLEAWLDQWDTYCHELRKKYEASVPVTLECSEGKLFLQSALLRSKLLRSKLLEATETFTQSSGMAQQGLEVNTPATGRMAAKEAVNRIQTAIDTMDSESAQCEVGEQVEVLLNPILAKAVEAVEQRKFLTQPEQTYEIEVERISANYASWYELFPRSLTDSSQSHGNFDDVIGRLPAIHAMGFDVLYLPPIHPIGHSNRKGRNNNVIASPGDPGSPYAIGSEEGGHDTVFENLGGLDGFRRLIVAVRDYGIEIALDFAIQCSPDHPWLKQHPGWFSWRPDGSLRYAENPPKKYQDIVNVDFYGSDATPSLWIALRDTVLYWVSEGVKIFRVDNPHTKPLPFWEWLIRDVRDMHPEVIFLSEAFTRPAMMYHLAKIGFSQSYTYFIWRNTRQELTDYLIELTSTSVADYYRPNFFVNTPDINPYFLQTSGRPGFLIRAALAATLSGLWGVYSGFELCESAALPGKEEYLDSEKYEIKPRDLSAPGNIIKEISRLNHIRKENPALQSHLPLKFYDASNDQVIYFGKFDRDKRNFILVAISLDPHSGQEAWLEVPTREFDLPESASLIVEELMRDLTLSWMGGRQHWYFNPAELPFAIWRIRSGEV